MQAPIFLTEICFPSLNKRKLPLCPRRVAKRFIVRLKSAPILTKMYEVLIIPYITLLMVSCFIKILLNLLASHKWPLPSRFITALIYIYSQHYMLILFFGFGSIQLCDNDSISNSQTVNSKQVMKRIIISEFVQLLLTPPLGVYPCFLEQISLAHILNFVFLPFYIHQ